MIDLTRYAIVRAGVLTASGQDEIHVRFVLKKDCEWAMKQRFGSMAKARKSGYMIVKLSPQQRREAIQR